MTEANVKPTMFNFRAFLKAAHIAHHKTSNNLPLDFRTWVTCLWNVCSLNQASLVR